MKIKVSDFSHKLTKKEEKEIKFVDLVGCKVKINNTYVKAKLIGGISLMEKDYQRFFSD